jgi:hypothetical protein
MGIFITSLFPPLYLCVLGIFASASLFILLPSSFILEIMDWKNAYENYSIA